MKYKLNIRQVSYALSEALDMVGIDDIINIGMLHDCGVSSTDTHISLVTELDWEGSQKHCIEGAKLLKKVYFYKEYADVVLYHHTHWSDLEKLDLSDNIKFMSNIILLTDRVDALRAQSKTHQEIINILNTQKNKMFKSELVDIFIEISKPDSFWLYLESDNLEVFMHEWISCEVIRAYEYKYLKEIAYMFSNIVDAKSSFTAEHSENVAKVALYISNKFNLTQKQQETLELAALLHDLGKLRVADAILNKKGPLNAEEKHIMDRHGFDSEMILRKIDGFKEVAYLASSHHETLDGKGYPYQKNKNDLSIESRILMLSDVFQALVQNRPYREQLHQNKILEILHEMKTDGKIDIDVLAVIEGNIDELYLIADS